MGIRLPISVAIFILLFVCSEVRTKDEKCRNQLGRMLFKEEFRLDSCGWCYVRIPEALFVHKWPMTISRGPGGRRLPVRLVNPGIGPDGNRQVVYANISDQDSPLLSSFAGDRGRELWKACCEAASECCDSMIEEQQTEGGMCPPTWSEWQCWKATKPGVTAKAECPAHMYFRHEPPSCTQYVTKTCLENGKWQEYRRGGGDFSNYTACNYNESICEQQSQNELEHQSHNDLEEKSQKNLEETSQKNYEEKSDSDLEQHSPSGSEPDVQSGSEDKSTPTECGDDESCEENDLDADSGGYSAQRTGILTIVPLVMLSASHF